MAERIQLKRTKGWRMPPNTVKVDRTTGWGNPCAVGQPGIETAADAVEAYRKKVASSRHEREQARQILRGKNLACWCPLDAPCHADVLLEIANG